VARVASLQDETGATTQYRVEYDRVRQQYTLHSQDPSGTRRTRTYNKTGRLLQDSINDQVQSQRTIDSETLERSTDARGQTTTTQYDSNRRPLQITHPDGSRDTYQYDGQGRTVRHTNPLGVVSTWAYDSAGNPVEHTQALGLPEQRTTRSTYDRWGQVTRRSQSADNNTNDTVVSLYEYDSAGNLTKTTNALGQSWSYSHNSQGQILSQTNPLGHTWTYAYNAAGQLLSETNPLGQTTTHQYNALGQRTQTTSAAGRTRQTVYDNAGRVIEQRQFGQTRGTQVAYDTVSRPTTTTSPSGLISTTAYDALGRLSQTTDPAGNTTRYSYGEANTPLAGLLTQTTYPTYSETYRYDQRGQQTQTIQLLDANATLPASTPVTRTQTQAFDASGQRISSTDPAGNTTLYRHDGLGRVIETIDPLNQSTRQSWNAQDQLTTVTDANGNTHRFAYDGAGRLTQETRPLGGATQYSHDAAGNLTQRTDAGGNTRRYTHDAAGRTTVEEHRMADGTLDQRITYAHDADGLLTGYEQQDGAGNLISSATYTLDAQGRSTQSAVTYGKATGGGTIAFTLGQGFNADGQLSSHTYPDGSSQSYSYAQGRLSQITLPNSAVISYSAYQWNAPGQITTPGTTKTLAYDALMRPVRIEVHNTANNTNTLLASRQYQYDEVGNISQIDSDLGSTRYGYDKLSRLTQAQPDSALQRLGLPQEQYGYDPVGNRTSSAHQPGTWAYNADNQLTQYPRTTPFSTAAAQDTQVSYTAQGHTAGEINPQGSTTLSYNAAERLVETHETREGGQTTRYRYDPFGRRISKSSGGVTTYYVNGDFALLAEADSTGQLTKAYGFNPQTAEQGLWSTDPLWQAQVVGNSLTLPATQYHHLHTDHLSTPMLATDRMGTPTWKGVSEAFGATRPVVEQVEMNLRYPGQYYDQETQSHYNLNRDYLPGRGRYWERDPIGLEGGINEFLYADGDPLNSMDSIGLSGCKWVGIGFVCDFNPPPILDPDFSRPSPNPSSPSLPDIKPAFCRIMPLACLVVGLVPTRKDVDDGVCERDKNPTQYPSSGADGGKDPNVYAKPPKNARDPNGPKAPGKPPEEVGFKDPKGGEDWAPNPNPGKGGNSHGWRDENGDVWVPTGQGGNAHGGPHWDVQSPGGGYRNVRPPKP
jgi:RHS repeat-associated protein